ncbi:type I restriction enzyme HsdR N-terminal domain-containing protein [Belliella sp. DSM 107340]|uniref:Type I restriction enzyme HsdR N-terminal domain-containing protein n=1 Tax=Belliella calami TaxID=2923436 RepID=A0ABS9UNP6_9BACT|nr:type I restriction enzyme HsdR N-terminal domain-containing protein [Belliella calami]MCH7398249.1 type I restriction enzyme HsdR N-terminal domain-containing protein [Belliella calami]
MIEHNYSFLQEPLNFPNFEFKLQEEKNGKISIFDSLRKKYLILTPEEWVRQHIIQVLIQKYKYPKSLFSMEKGLKYNLLQKRFDVLVHDRNGMPFLLVECKAPEIKLTQKTVEQVCIYNKTINAPYIGITNGKLHLFLQFDQEKGQFVQIRDLPSIGHNI